MYEKNIHRRPENRFFGIYILTALPCFSEPCSLSISINMVDVPTSPKRKCNIHVYDTALQPIYPKNIILTHLVLVHAGYLFCHWHPLNTNYRSLNFLNITDRHIMQNQNFLIIGGFIIWNGNQYTYLSQFQVPLNHKWGQKIVPSFSWHCLPAHIVDD